MDNDENNKNNILKNMHHKNRLPSRWVNFQIYVKNNGVYAPLTRNNKLNTKHSPKTAALFLFNILREMDENEIKDIKIRRLYDGTIGWTQKDLYADGSIADGHVPIEKIPEINVLIGESQVEREGLWIINSFIKCLRDAKEGICSIDKTDKWRKRWEHWSSAHPHMAEILEKETAFFEYYIKQNNDFPEEEL